MGFPAVTLNEAASTLSTGAPAVVPAVPPPTGPSPFWYRSAYVVEGANPVSFIETGLTAGRVVTGIAGWFLASMTIDLVTNPDRYIGDEPLPIEAPAIEPEIIEQPIQDYEIIASDEVVTPPEPSPDATTQELLDAGYDPLYSLFLGVDMAACQGMMMARIPDVSRSDLVRNLKEGVPVSVKGGWEHSAVHPLQHAFDQHVANTIGMIVMWNGDFEGGLPYINANDDLWPCSARYMETLADRGLVHKQLRDHLRDILPSVIEFEKYCTQMNTLTPDRLEYLRRFIAAAQTVI
jgi:hypothetical protein